MNVEKEREVLDLTDKHDCQQTTEVQSGVAKSSWEHKQKKGHNTESFGRNW